MWEREGPAFQAPEFSEWAVPPPLTEEPPEVQTGALPYPYLAQEADGQPPSPLPPHIPGPGAHSQLLQARVELHVHGVERVQAAPVLYVSGEEKQGQVSRGATDRHWLEARETWVQIPSGSLTGGATPARQLSGVWILTIPDAPGVQAESMPTHPPWMRRSHQWPRSAGR